MSSDEARYYWFTPHRDFVQHIFIAFASVQRSWNDLLFTALCKLSFFTLNPWCLWPHHFYPIKLYKHLFTHMYIKEKFKFFWLTAKIVLNYSKSVSMGYKNICTQRNKSTWAYGKHVSLKCNFTHSWIRTIWRLLKVYKD